MQSRGISNTLQGITKSVNARQAAQVLLLSKAMLQKKMEFDRCLNIIAKKRKYEYWRTVQA